MPKSTYTLAPPTEQDLFRLHSKYICGLTPDACYEWLAGKRVGYGAIIWRDIDGKWRSANAHRVMYMISRGEDPGDLNVCHTCDDHGCINENHLFLGTDDDNMQDKTRKRRQSHGSKHGMAKTNESEVAEIRRRHAESGKKVRTFAREITAEYPHLSFSSLRAILRRTGWKLAETEDPSLQVIG